jgi:hypothetical protein
LRPVTVAVLVLIVASVYAGPVSAADIAITFDKEQVRAKMLLSVHQNMTAFPSELLNVGSGDYSLPHTSRDPALFSAIQDALKATNSSASFSSMNLRVASSASWLNLTLSMDLIGVSERRGDVVFVNTTWKAFHAQADLRAGNVSYNTIGSTYLRPVLDFYVNASKFEDRPNATVKAVTFFVNGTESVAGTNAANLVGNFTVLDLRFLNVPLEEWTRTYGLFNNTTSWRYTPPVMLNASVRVQELNRTFTIFSYYAYDAEITVPGLAQAQGSIVRADVGTGQKEWIMTGVVVLAVVLAIVVQIMFRRRRKVVRLGRR